MGAGPEKLLDAGLERTLRESGHTVHTKVVELSPGSWHAEIQTSFELMRLLARAVREARESGRLPIVLAGNCNTAVGTVAGLGARLMEGAARSLDGTAVAILTGRCWTQLAATVPGFTRIADERVCLIGTRDVDALEGALLDESRVSVIEPKHLRSGLPRTLKSIRGHVTDMYVHLDLDVLDSAVAPANSYALTGGLTLDDLDHALAQIASKFTITGITLSAYDPAFDTDESAAKSAIRMISTAARVAERA